MFPERATGDTPTENHSRGNAVIMRSAASWFIAIPRQGIRKLVSSDARAGCKEQGAARKALLSNTSKNNVLPLV
jgi:hypothetical protein